MSFLRAGLVVILLVSAGGILNAQSVPAGALVQEGTPIPPAPGKVTGGRVLFSHPPMAPQEIRVNHISGTVVLSVLIGKNGKVKDVKVTSTTRATLNEAAMDAVRDWKYEPFCLDGVPTEYRTSVTMSFNGGQR
jgi:protein TonB